MSTLSKLLPMVESAIDTAFGERVLITPMTCSEYVVGVPDPDIAPFECVGIVSVDVSVMTVSGTRYKAKQDAPMVGARAEISFRGDAFSDARPVPKKDWVLTRIEKAGGPQFRVSYSRRDSEGRVHCMVEPL